MLTAIRNIWTTIFHYDELRLGHEESFYMEPKTILLSDQFCRGCHQPHSLDENKRCEFCRRDPVEPRVSLFTLIGRAISGLISRPRQQDISIIRN